MSISAKISYDIGAINLLEILTEKSNVLASVILSSFNFSVLADWD
jgi:hypothetical protein